MSAWQTELTGLGFAGEYRRLDIISFLNTKIAGAGTDAEKIDILHKFTRILLDMVFCNVERVYTQ